MSEIQKRVKTISYLQLASLAEGIDALLECLMLSGGNLKDASEKQKLDIEEALRFKNEINSLFYEHSPDDFEEKIAVSFDHLKEGIAHE